MSAWIVYSKDGLTERCVLKSLEYGGTHMGERAVTATFDSASEVAFEVFDYIEYRGEKFELEAVPTVKKTSDFNYEYELRFVSLKYELERCEMRDLVPYDNEVVYPTPLTFSFTGNVRYLTERIQACLDALYGSGIWNIIIADGVESEEKNITIAQQNCWNALALVSTTYGLNFYVKGRTITIGGEQSLVGHTFEYGKGNGLYEIERAADTGTGIVTKLRAYGASRNLDYSYPKKPEWNDSVLPVSFALSPLRLMLPSFKTDGKTDFVLADEATIAKYGIREASMVYDDIYPTITGATYNGQAIDEIKAVDEVDDNSGSFVIYLHDLGFDLEEHLTTSDAQISMKTGAMQGYTFTIIKIEKQYENTATADATGEVNPDEDTPEGDTPEEDLGEFIGYRITLNRISAEGGDNYNIPNSDWSMKAGDKFVLLNILMPQMYIREAENRLKERAEEYLAQYGKTNFSYNIGLHDKFLVENPSVYDSLIEGSRLRVRDAEIGIDEEVTIQSITITENAEDNILPQVKVTLNNEPSASTLDRIQGKLNDVASEVAANGFTAQSEIMTQYRKKLDKPFFEKLFVAIDKDGNEIAANDVTTPVAYILAKYDFASVGGMTMYANRGLLNIPSIYDGLPIDWQTIYWEDVKDAEGNVIGRVLKAAGGSGEGGTVSGITLEQLEAYLGVNKYATQSWVEEKGYLSAITSKLITDALGFTPYDSAKLSGELGKYLPLTGGRINGKLGVGCTPTEKIDILNNIASTNTFVHTKRGDTGYGISFGIGGGGVNRGLYDDNLSRWIIYSDDVKTNLTQNIWINQDEWNGGLKLNRNTSGGGCGVSVYSNGAELGQFGIAGNNRFEFDVVSDGVNVTRFYVNPNGDGFVDGEFSMRSAKINGGNLTYNSTNKYWKLEGDLLVTGGISMFGSDSDFVSSTIMDALSVDEVNLKVVNGVLTFVGKTGGGTADSVQWENVDGKPTFSTVATSGKYSDLIGIPTLLSSFTDDVVSGKYLPIGGGTISSTSYAPITIERADSPYSAAIRFSNGVDGVLGEIGVGGSGNVSGKVPFFAVGDSSYELLHVGNYTTHTVKKDGTGATGIWGIGITGNAATATTASKLSTVSKTAWGQTYWTSGGVPTSIDGNMSNVGHITMKSNTSYDIGTSSVGVRYIYANWIGAISGGRLSLGANNATAITILTDQKVGIGTKNPSTALQVDQSEWANGITINRTVSGGGGAIAVRSNGTHIGNFGINGSKQLEFNVMSGSTAQVKMTVDSSGNGLFYGGITMYSDIRKKTILNHVELSLKEVADAPLIEHYYNSDEKKTTHVGSVAQYWAGLNDWFCKEDGEGFLTMEIQNAALASVISVARELTRYESKTDKQIKKLKKRIGELEEEIENLKKM